MCSKLEEYEASLKDRIAEEGVNLTPLDLVISLKRITAGLGRRSPVERVLFVDSRGKCVNYSSKYLKEMMNIEEETILVMLRKEGEVGQLS